MKQEFRFSVLEKILKSPFTRRQFRPAGRRALPVDLQFQTLEERRMLSVQSVLPMPAFDIPLSDQQEVVASVWPDARSATQNTAVLPSDVEQVLSLPSGLPATFSLTIEFEGERLTLELEKNSVYGENTRFLVDDGSGQLTEIDLGVDRSYLGSVAQRPEFAVSAVLTEQGLVANIIRPNQASIVITPAEGPLRGAHTIALDEDRAAADDVDSGFGEGHDHSEGEEANPSASTSPITVDFAPSSGEVAAASIAGATLPPTRVTDIQEFEIGVEIGSRAFFASSAYDGNLQTAQNTVNMIVGNLDARFLHSAGVKHRLGTVIIRTDANNDPLRDSVTATGAAANANSSLSAFRNYWNSNPGIVGNTHDLAVYHVLSAPSGLAYVNSVGSSNRYATTGGNGPTSWADGTLAHEFGHSWGLAHVNEASQYYENRPRNNNGSNSAGGRDDFISIMHGSGDHNIGRLATSEANIVRGNQDSKSQFGDLVTGFQVKPFGVYDDTVATNGPVVIDVIANDYDVNNDVLNVQLLDTVSFLGGTISLSVGTGPGGRDEIVYTPPTNVGTADDFFHYTVVDSTGRTDFGAVNVAIEGPVTVDTTLTSYSYDLGTVDSVVFPDHTLISNQTFGEYGFISAGPNPVEARDRGAPSGSGVNNINRDLIRLRSTSTFHHTLANGSYDVLITVGDRIENTDPIRFTAEGSEVITTLAHAAAEFTNYKFENLDVTDGELSLDIENLGFSANLTRIVITKLSELVTVDTTQSSYLYDLGTTDSIVFGGYTRISHISAGDLGFVSTGSTPVQSRDRGVGPGVNDLNRDHIRLLSTATFEHKLVNGSYDVLITVGDADETTDPIRFTAEGSVVVETLAHSSGQFTNYSFQDLDVTDGELNLDIENLGFSANLTRIVITQISKQVTVDTNQTEFYYDVGASDSVLFIGSSDTYVRLPHNWTGDIEFVGGNPQSFDRGSGSGVNDINRDGVLVSGSTTFNHRVANGIWSVLLNIGDRDFMRDDIQIGAEGQTFFADVDRAASSFNPNLIFEVPVSDGQLNLNLDDLGGDNHDISVTRVILRRVADLPSASVEERYVFYNNSYHDGNNDDANADDDAALDTDKVPLLPGQTATFANYTSYDKGVNGIFIDVENLRNGAALSELDFLLATGNGSDLSDFTTLTTELGVSVRVGAGVGGSDRVTLTLGDELVTGRWLQVTMLANDITGLDQNDVFYIGNAIGDTGNSEFNSQVTSVDEIGARNHPRNFTNRADAENVYDFNRDSLVTSQDEILARNNNTNLNTDLNLITAPGAPPEAAPQFASISADQPTPTAAAVSIDSQQVSTGAVVADELPVDQQANLVALPTPPLVVRSVERTATHLRKESGHESSTHDLVLSGCYSLEKAELATKNLEQTSQRQSISLKSPSAGLDEYFSAFNEDELI